MDKFEPVIGLEIHVQLKTISKMFCPCDNDSEGRAPNSLICPVCTGQPGVLPATNQKAVEFALMAALALNCAVNKNSHFDRKSYFYPDLPKGFQISQHSSPFGKGGYLIIKNMGRSDRISIERVHLEEDTAKLLHEADKSASYVDYNRAGTPLLEIVTEPDIDQPESARFFLQELKLIMKYLQISDADMEKGHLRCDANISLRPNPQFWQEKIKQFNVKPDSSGYYPKTEIKNLNSFRSVEKALSYEIARQAKLWEAGQPPSFSSTRGWDDKKEVTVEQRTKEEKHDYRYFPEPDLPPFKFEAGFLKKIKNNLPELPQEKRGRFQKQYLLSNYDSEIIVSDRELANYFEKVITELRGWLIDITGGTESEEEIWSKNKKKLVKIVANWLINRFFALINNSGISLEKNKITPENFAEFISLIYERRLNNQTAALVLEKMFASGDDPSDLMEQEKIDPASPAADLDKIIDVVIAENQKVVQEYQSGKKPALQFLIGQVMKSAKGNAEPSKVTEKIIHKLG